MDKQAMLRLAEMIGLRSTLQGDDRTRMLEAIVDALDAEIASEAELGGWYCDEYEPLRDRAKKGPFTSDRLAAAREIYADFSDVPINDKDEILESFHSFPEGTSRFRVLKWIADELKLVGATLEDVMNDA